MNLFQTVGHSTLGHLTRIGRATLFLRQTLLGCGRIILRGRLIIEQIHAVGVLTMMIIVVAGLFVGMVLGFQGYHTLIDYGAESSLGLLVAVSLTRELGPVLSALLFAGRAGSAITAEIGLMKATDQIAGMEMMAVDPVSRVVAPRFLAGIIALPLLAAMFAAVGIGGGYLIGTLQLGVDSGVYWSTMQQGIDIYDDIFNGVIKSIVFGVVVAWIAVFEGYDATPTSEGVAQATKRTVVIASLSVLALDYLLTALMFGGI